MLLATAVTPAPGPAPATRDVVPLLLGGCDPGSPINVRPGRVTCVWCGGPTRQPCPRPRPRRLPCPRHADLACVPCVTPTSASGEHPMSAGHSGRGGWGLCPPARLPRVDFGHLPRLPPTPPAQSCSASSPGGPAPAARRRSPGLVPLPQVPGAVPACQVGAASQVLVSFWKLQGAGGGGLPREPGLSSAEVSSGSSVALGQAHLSEDAST